MKTKLLLMTALPLALMAAGCGKKQSEDNNMPMTNNPATEQTAPSAATPKNEMSAPVANMAETNMSAHTNWPSTNNPATASP